MWSRREDYVPDCRAGDKYEHRDDWMPPGQALHDRQYDDHEHREPRQAGEDSAVDPRAEEMAVAGQAAFPFLIECVLINGAEIGALAPVRGQQVDIVTPDDRIIGCRPPTDPGPLGDRTERRGRLDRKSTRLNSSH